MPKSSSAKLTPKTLDGLDHERKKALRSNHDRGAAVFDQAAQLRHEALVSAEVDGRGQRDRNQAGVLAAKEYTKEIRVRLGDHCHTIALAQAKRDELAGEADGVLAQIRKRQRGVQIAATAVEICPGNTL